MNPKFRRANLSDVRRRIYTSYLIDRDVEACDQLHGIWCAWALSADPALAMHADLAGRLAQRLEREAL